MKKTGYFLLITLFIASCGGNDVETLTRKINTKRGQVQKLNNQIHELEKKVAKLDSSAHLVSYKKVTVKEVQPEMFAKTIKISGVVEAENEAMISPEMGGRITAIHVDEGQYVNKGQQLVTLNTSVTQASIEELKTGLELAEKMYKKQEALYEQGVGSEVEYLQAKNSYESAKKRLNTLTTQLGLQVLTAPFPGIVENIMNKVGEQGAPGMPIVHLVNMNNLKITAGISEKYLNTIKQGMPVKVLLPLYDSLVLDQKLSRVGSVIDPATRTFTVELNFNNPGNKIKPNSLAVININTYKNDSALVIPSIVIKEDIQNRHFIFKAVEQNDTVKAVKSFIQPGIAFNAQSEIKSGLEKGDRVVVRGFDNISENEQIEVINK